MGRSIGEVLDAVRQAAADTLGAVVGTVLRAGIGLVDFAE